MILRLNKAKVWRRLSSNIMKFRFCNAVYAQDIVNKYLVSRTPFHKYSIYAPENLTVGQFKQQVEKLFPAQSLGVTTKIDLATQQMGSKIDEIKQKEILQSIKDYPFFDALLLNRFILYEKNQNKQLEIIYGVEVTQSNLTNRINIPEHVQEGVVQLNNQWSSATQMTIGQALSFDNIPKFQGANLSQDDKDEKMKINKLAAEEQAALDESIAMLIRISKIQSNVIPFLPNARKLMRRIIALMSVNWLILFYLTYAKYGWDVGQPVSYLTGLGVDLIALAGIFQSSKALENQKQLGKRNLQLRLNLEANLRMAKWRVAFLSRKLSF